MKLLRSLSITTTGLVLAAATHAQVVYGTDFNSGSENFFHDVSAATNAGPVWTGAEAWGMGDDDANSVMYINDGITLYAWPYNDPNPATLVGTIMISGGGGANLAATYLAYSNGFLYGGTNINTEGVYEIDVVTQMATIMYIYPSAADIDIGGFDVDPATGLFYGSNDDTSHPGGSGIIEIDVAGMTETHIAPYPAGETDIDGLAFDPSGVVYLLEDEPSVLHNYDIGTMTYDPMPPMNAIPAGRVFSAGTYTSLGPGFGPIGTPDPGCTPLSNSIGTFPTVSLVGTGSAGDDVEAQLTNGKPDEFGYWISGPNTGTIPAGCGIVCIGTPQYRYNSASLGHLFQFDAAGVSQAVGGGGANILPTDGSFAAVPPVMVGETRGFQGWYRDDGCTAAGQEYNFSNSVLVTFQ